MRWSLAAIALLGMITVVSIISFEGGENMTLFSKGPAASIGIPPSDMHNTGAIETATFSLG
jgi:hypothetical protein